MNYHFYLLSHVNDKVSNGHLIYMNTPLNLVIFSRHININHLIQNLLQSNSPFGLKKKKKNQINNWLQVNEREVYCSLRLQGFFRWSPHYVLVECFRS